MYVETMPTKGLALVPLVALAQSVADLFDRSSRLIHARRIDRFTDADPAMSAVIIAEAVQQVGMAVKPVASAIAVQLGQQLGMLARGRVGVVSRPGEHRGVQGHDVVIIAGRNGAAAIGVERACPEINDR